MRHGIGMIIVCYKSIENRLCGRNLKSFFLKNLCSQPIFIIFHKTAKSQVCSKQRFYYPLVVLDFSIDIEAIY